MQSPCSGVDSQAVRLPQYFANTLVDDSQPTSVCTFLRPHPRSRRTAPQTCVSWGRPVWLGHAAAAGIVIVDKMRKREIGRRDSVEQVRR